MFVDKAVKTCWIDPLQNLIQERGCWFQKFEIRGWVQNMSSQLRFLNMAILMKQVGFELQMYDPYVGITMKIFRQLLAYESSAG